jgi:hypothetical protein
VTLPRGPREVSAVWRAQARIGVAIHSTVVWSSTHIVPEVITVLTRITEKTALWTMMVLEEVVKRLQSEGRLAGVREICHWSDCGPAYRSLHWLSAACARWPVLWSANIRIRYGLESHFKSKCDMVFSMLHRWLSLYEKRRLLRYPSDLVEVFTEAAACCTTMHYTFFELVPNMEKTKFAGIVKFVQRASLPSPIKASQDFSFTRVDTRRLSIVGRDLRTISGVMARSHGLPGLRASILTSGFCVLATATEAAEAMLEDEATDLAVVPAPDEVGMNVREVMGFRSSYRLSEPEVCDESKTVAKLRKKADHFVGMGMAEAGRSMRQ